MKTRLLALVFALFLLALGTPLMAEEAAAPAAPAATATISGKVAPQPGGTNQGMVAFFRRDGGPPPTPGAFRRVPDQVALLNENGEFSAELEPACYYIGFIMGRTEAMVGPPREGEYTFVAHDAEGNPQRFTVEAGDKLEAGTLSGKVPTPVEVSDFFTVKGTISDENGTPLQNAIVLAFKVEDQLKRPSYMLQASNPDGSYELKLAAGSAYHVTVRTRYGGGQPQPGEFVGRYGEQELKPVSAQAGETVAGADIKVFQVPQPGPSKSKGERQLQNPPLANKPEGVGPPAMR